jgi:hypothetical protein
MKLLMMMKLRRHSWMHIKTGFTLIHDMEKSNNRVVSGLGLKNQFYNAREIAKLPNDKVPLWDVNRPCCLLMRFLDSHPDNKREKCQTGLSNSLN